MKSVSLRDMHAAYLDIGEGPPIIFAHCSSASHRQWASLAKTLAGEHRVLVPDLLGYGASTPWPPEAGSSVASDLDALKALAAIAGSGVHLIGHSYGAALCLELARTAAAAGGCEVRSICLIEPVSFHLLRTGGRIREWNEIASIARRVVARARQGKLKQAANSYMGFWLGGLKWRLAPRRFRREVIATMPKVAHEFSTMFENGSAPCDYAAIDCPVTLIRGGQSKQPALAVIDLLQQALRQAELHDIPDAGHMSPFTHKKETGALVQDHLLRACG